MNKQRKEPVILVINQSLNLLNLFHEILEDEGFEVELSNFTFEGVGTIDQLQPDLIIMDFDGQGENNQWQLLQMLKMHGSSSHIPILLIALAIEAFREQEEYLRSKNIGLLYKPFEKNDLLAAVHQAFDS
ncbi:MAG: response regulator transcription factor [Ktedonobacteraceae bacterium]|nr:response regulator transcription factor [Ktedonobacteraceae bacterium]